MNRMKQINAFARLGVLLKWVQTKAKLISHDIISIHGGCFTPQITY